MQNRSGNKGFYDARGNARVLIVLFDIAYPGPSCLDAERIVREAVVQWQKACAGRVVPKVMPLSRFAARCSENGGPATRRRDLQAYRQPLAVCCVLDDDNCVGMGDSSVRRQLEKVVAGDLERVCPQTLVQLTAAMDERTAGLNQALLLEALAGCRGWESAGQCAQNLAALLCDEAFADKRLFAQRRQRTTALIRAFFRDFMHGGPESGPLPSMKVSSETSGAREATGSTDSLFALTDAPAWGLPEEHDTAEHLGGNVVYTCLCGLVFYLCAQGWEAAVQNAKEAEVIYRLAHEKTKFLSAVTVYTAAQLQRQVREQWDVLRAAGQPLAQPVALVGRWPVCTDLPWHRSAPGGGLTLTGPMPALFAFGVRYEQSRVMSIKWHFHRQDQGAECKPANPKATPLAG